MKIRHATVGLDRNFLNTIPMIAARWAGDGLLKRSQQVGLGRIYVLAGGDTAGPGDLVRMLDLATGRPRVSSPLADSGLTIARVSTPEGLSGALFRRWWSRDELYAPAASAKKRSRRCSVMRRRDPDKRTGAPMPLSRVELDWVKCETR
jgi:hypothetical protein